MNNKCFDYLYPLSILAILLYSYYAYIIEVCLNKFIYVDKQYKYVYLIFTFYHLNFILILWSFFKTMVNTEIKIPAKYRLKDETIKYFESLDSEDNQDGISIKSDSQLVSDIYVKNVSRQKFTKIQREFLENYCKKKGLVILTRTDKGDVNICLECKIIKPDRCHHCRRCDKCVLRMDHHCPYLNRCVGFKNQKYFTLFLIYIIIYIFFILLTTMHSFIQCWNETFYNYRTEYHIFCMVTISICAIIPVLSVLIYTLRATALNRTSLEQEFVPVEAATNKENIYLFDLGSWKENFQDIFGKNMILALLPIWSTPNDGCEYKILREV
jgi:hypothetical protein